MVEGELSGVRAHVSEFVFCSGERLVDTRFEFLIYAVSYIFHGISGGVQPAAGAIFLKELSHDTIGKQCFEHDLGAQVLKIPAAGIAVTRK